MTVPGFPTVFRGSDAVAAGLVTWSLLRGAEFDRLLPDVYGLHRDGRRDLALRSRAAYRWGAERGVLSGWSAAELLGADCAPLTASAELTVPGGGLRSRTGVIVRRDRLHPGEITTVADVRTTTPMRTAFDLGCRSAFVAGVVAVDALARVHRFPPDLLLNFAVRYPRARGVHRFPDVLAYADPKAGSPPESRLRLLLVLAGLPRPTVQHPCSTTSGAGPSGSTSPTPSIASASSTTAATTCVPTRSERTSPGTPGSSRWADITGALGLDLATLRLR